MIRSVLLKIRTEGIWGLFRKAWRTLFPLRLDCCEQYLAHFKDKVGLEIGGPSFKFGDRGMLPVYPIAQRIDNCNFSHKTVWEGNIEDGSTYVFHREKQPGCQFILEATDLNAITSQAYDFVLSSHALEHIANPLLALEEFKRVLKMGGYLL
jgi:hypothetical protein